MEEYYNESDFKIIKDQKRIGNPEIAYEFQSRDENIDANFFWIPHDVQMRVLYWEGETLLIGFPFAGGEGPVPTPGIFLHALVTHLKRNNIKKSG